MTAARDRLAEVVATHRLVTPRQCFCGDREPYDERDAGFHRPEWHVAHALSALLPVVEQIAAERAAEELRKLGREALEQTPGASRVHIPASDLFDRAAALAPEETP